jgi:Flp pilus assembly protein TadD
VRCIGAVAWTIGIIAITVCEMSLAGPTAHAAAPDTVTFSGQIAAVLFEHCVSCHRADGAAPFPLLTYTDAFPRARAIAEAAERRAMPPWLPAHGITDFVGERRLRAEEIRFLRRWADEGAPEGDRALMPDAPVWHTGWQLGEPDLVISMPRSYHLGPGARDVYRNFVLPVPITTRRYVRAVELWPDNSRIVHHATLTIDRTRWSRYRDGQDPEPGYDGMLGGSAESPDGHFLAWTPGRTVRPEPDDMAWRLDPGSDLVLQLHMMPQAREASIRVRVGLFFTERPPARVPLLLRIGPKAIDIPAGRRDYIAEDEYVLPVDVDLLALYPHAHYLAREMIVTARRGDGSERRLLEIPAWDFHWQDEYRYVRPVRLPRGTTIAMRFVYDNSAANRSSPIRPPRRVVYGPQSTDEMADLWLQVLPGTAVDRAMLRAHFLRREVRADISGCETLLRARPTDVPTHLLLGLLYGRLGRSNDAERQYSDALLIAPDDWLARYDLGASFQAENRLNEARREYLAAERANPRAAEVQHALGTLEFAGGRLDLAIARYRGAIRLWPEYADAHASLGTALAKSGQPQEAIAEYRVALTTEPDHIAALNNLAILLGSAGHAEEAVTLLRHAVEVAPNDDTSRRNLAAAVELAKR